MVLAQTPKMTVGEKVLITIPMVGSTKETSNPINYSRHDKHSADILSRERSEEEGDRANRGSRGRKEE